MIEPKYDISIALPVTDATKFFFKRFLDQKKYGFVNLQNRKVQLRLLLGPDEDFYGNDVLKGWNPSIDVVRVDTPFLDVARKIAWMFQNTSEDDILNAKWHAKFDDDSINDIGRIMTILDEDFDWNRAEFLCCDSCPDLDEQTLLALKAIKHEYLRSEERVCHELEGSIISQAAFLAFRNNELAMRYLEERLKHPGGFGDHALCICLYFCKVHPVKVGFMSFWNELPKFTLFGGHYAHVHMHMESHIEFRTFSVVKAILDGVRNLGSEMLSGKEFDWFRQNHDRNGRMRFNEHNKVYNGNGGYEGVWGPQRTGDGVIIVFNNVAWLAYELMPNQDGGFDGICPDTKLPVKLTPVR